ncbi:MinD/ParA family protein [Dasania sp. GY-MA-18]|uniref:MinD/ParA family protein n=1 Tax=Dasania phycosphaerae TaxID=2950436 RepID=A0A9J6RHW9_9GAMM|nr:MULTISPECIES: MinD/ParA family protein [Dasania]MCR8921169.1 MinD/ParA family protein [Dasania sp. GY-MA-18]MCZ0863597.1 MinD/ParA family protein [Dasania phycosphaerae]MCZ0867325.1 MinD/ParA family protein [Dasania phycosphaerae]
MQSVTRQSSPQPAMPRVIAICSGKGGVGKSSIAVNLGITLAKQGFRVCLLDADTGLANVNILLGVQPKYSLEHVLYGAKAIDEVMVAAPHNLKIIPGANGISECATLHPRQQLRLTRELARIEHEFDYLLIDNAAGIADASLDFIAAAQYSLVVITPEPTSLTDAFSLIKLLKRRQGRILFRVVVNMCEGSNEGRAIFSRFAAAVEKYIGVELQYLGYLPRDESVRAAVTLQNPVAMFPDTDPSSQSFIRLAQALTQDSNSLPAGKSFSAYWYKQFKQSEQHKSKAQLQSAGGKSAEKDKLLENDYVAELHSRLLLAIEKGSADREAVERMLRAAVQAYFTSYQHSPLDGPSFIEQLILSPDRDDYQLREMSAKLKPWAEPTVSEPTEQPLALAATAATKAKSLRSCPNSNQAQPVSSVSLYDKKRFGSQDELLRNIKQQHSDTMTLLTILEAYTG